MKAVDELIDDGLFESQSFYLQSKLTEQEVISPLRQTLLMGKLMMGKNQMTTLIALRLA